MWKLIKKTLVFIFFGRQRPKPLPKPLMPDPLEWKHTAVSYSCWGCDKKETLSLEPESTKAVERAFWSKWGPIEESQKLLFRGDRSYTSETFCPACQKVISKKATLTGFGYQASELAALLKDPGKDEI